jgi:hypothetical protein
VSELKIIQLFSELNATLKSTREIRKAYNKQIAFEFNALEFIWPDENKISEILAYFLNPFGKHGQGNLFLKSFMEIVCSEDVVSLYSESEVEIKREHSTFEGRRIDILISFKNRDYVIGIENKIYDHTQDQPSQISHYNKELENLQKSGNYLLLYLAPIGKELSEGSLSKVEREALEKANKFKAISYEADIIPLIEKWQLNCQAIRVKSFLQDFEQYLKNKYTGEKFMDEKNVIVKKATDSANIEAALSIIQNAENIYKELLLQLKGDLEKNKPDGLTLKWDLKREQRYANFSFYSVALDRLNLKIEFAFDKSYCQDFFFGFPRKNPEQKLDDNLVKKLVELFNARFGISFKSDTWECWVYHPKYKNWNPMTFNDIATGEMKNDILQKLTQMIEIADELSKLNSQPIS